MLEIFQVLPESTDIEEILKLYTRVGVNLSVLEPFLIITAADMFCGDGL